MTRRAPRFVAEDWANRSSSATLVFVVGRRVAPVVVSVSVMRNAQLPFVIVMAGGSGVRLQGLTAGRDGVAVPKQFCSLRHGRSLMQDTIDRALQETNRDRVIVVVVAQHERWWREQLAGIPAENIVVQPENRGTAAALLLAVGIVRSRQARARVAVLPSDHFVEQPAVLQTTLQRALHRAALDRLRVFLLGIEPDAPETDYGWVVPGRGEHGVHVVDRFVEKPPVEVAVALQAQGALWHSFVVVADADALWQLGVAASPAVTNALSAAVELGADERAAALPGIYRDLPSLDFARHLLPGKEMQLSVLRVPPCGWTDLGTPARLSACARRLLQGGSEVPHRAEPVVDLIAAARAQHLLEG